MSRSQVKVDSDKNNNIRFVAGPVPADLVLSYIIYSPKST